MARNKNNVNLKGGKILKENIPNKRPINIKPTSLPATFDSQRRFNPGQITIAKIRKLQNSVNNLITKASFQRIVRSNFSKLDNTMDHKFQRVAFGTLQEACESFLVNVLEDAHKLAIHAKRVTLLPRDIKLIYKIKHSKDFTINMIDE